MSFDSGEFCSVDISDAACMPDGFVDNCFINPAINTSTSATTRIADAGLTDVVVLIFAIALPPCRSVRLPHASILLMRLIVKLIYCIPLFKYEVSNSKT